MRKLTKVLCAGLALSLSCGIFAACGDTTGNGGQGDVKGTFDYNTPFLSTMDNVSTDYNSNLFYVNTLDFQVADPTVIYVYEGEEAGWFYAYGTSDQIGCQGFQAWRSKDLAHWECTGIAFQPDFSEAWATFNYWAPEVIYDAEEKLYYLFYNAYNQYDNNRLCLSVAYSENPYGPFVSPDGRKNADGKMLYASEPVYDVTSRNPVLAELDRENEGLDFIKAQALDASPFIDPVTGEKYLYFSYYDNYGIGSFIYGMKMKDWFTPDYSTLTAICYPGYATVQGGYDKDSSQKLVDLRNEGGVNEGPFMVYKNGLYYMSFSVYGYTDPLYQVRIAVADSPLGAFEKVDALDGGTTLITNPAWTHITSAGHHCFITVGDEVFIAYHTFYNRTSIDEGRALAVDKVLWTKNSEGLDVMYVNGPSYSIQPLPEAISGYKNIATSAKIESDNTAEGSDVKLLNDGLIKYEELDLITEYFTGEGKTKITLTWDELKTVRGLMLYQALNYDYTFVSIDKIEMQFMQANGKMATVSIEDLPFDWDWNCDYDYLSLRPGGAAIAEFDELPVNKITITLTTPSGAEGIALSEIVVLGKDEACAGVSEFKEYSYENREYGPATIVKDSEVFGTVEGTDIKTTHGYDLTNDDGTGDAYIKQQGATDQFAYFKDIYTTSFYMEAEFTIPASESFALDPFPKFGIAMTCTGQYKNTIFFYVDAVNYSLQRVGCAQRTLDNSDWDWDATEQLVDVNINYTNNNYVKMAVLRQGEAFYMICNDKVAIYYDSFNVFTANQNSAVGFLSFNTPMIIRNYYATADASVLAEKATQYTASITGENFGRAGAFNTTSGWDLTNDRGEEPTAVQTSKGDQFAYFKGVNTTSFYVETEISATKDLGDPFPKIGLAARVGTNTLFFFIDATGGYTSQSVGWVCRNELNTDWTWETDGLSGMKDLTADGILGSYKGGEYVKLGLLRDGATFKMYVNDVCVFTVTNLRGFSENDNCVAAVLTFTTGVTVRNYSVELDADKIAAKKES